MVIQVWGLLELQIDKTRKEPPHNMLPLKHKAYTARKEC
jgi:hypothetical protein